MAPEISLLEPQVLQGVISKMEVKDDLVLLKSAPRESVPFPFVQWEITRGQRRMAAPNVPNAEAYIIPRYASGQQSASLVYLRDKKTFQPTTLHWLKTVGQGQSNRANAEAAVMRELEDLNNRFDVFWEYSLWQAVQGSLTYAAGPGVNGPSAGAVTTTVDYGMASSHQVTPTWGTGTTIQTIANNFSAWRRLIQVDGQVNARTVYGNSDTLTKIMELLATSTNEGMLSDRMKDQYFSSGQIDGFLSLDWRPVDAEYTDASGNVVKFIEDDKLIIGNFTDGRPYSLVQGPSADHEAPSGFVGRFTKTFIQPDPSDRTILLEEHALPVVKKPDQFVVADITF